MPVDCPHCGKHFPNSSTVNSRHKAVCSGWQSELGDLKPLACLCGHEELSLTQMKRHRQVCDAWKGRNRGQVQMQRLAVTLQANHGEGITHPIHLASAEVQRRQTCKDRYGAENVFSRESLIFDKVRESLEGKRVVLRGADNPFSQPEVQEKIRQTHQERRGVDNPQQDQSVRARTRATNLERYGFEHVLSAPEIREAIKVTNQERYGGPSPSCSEAVRELTQQTNQERYGVNWTCQDPEVRRKQLQTMVEHYGSHFFSSEVGRSTIRAALVERYGVDHPMKNPAIALKALEAAGGHRLKNGLERQFQAMFPQLLYTGNGGFWRWLPALGHHKNADFIIPGPDVTQPKQGVSQVVEVFGDYWHSRMFTGRAAFDHESELVAAYAEIGISCLVIWEGELKLDPEQVRHRVLEWSASGVLEEILRDDVPNGVSSASASTPQG